MSCTHTLIGGAIAGWVLGALTIGLIRTPATPEDIGEMRHAHDKASVDEWGHADLGQEGP